MKKKIVSRFEVREHLLISPELAWVYVQNYFDKKGINASQVAKVIGVSRSKVTGFWNGGTLSEKMAEKLGQHDELPVKLLFKLDASSHTYKAGQLMRPSVA